MIALAMFVGAYVLGSVPAGLIAGQVVRGVDVREFGSGKTGFTNSLRTLGPGVAFAVLAFDIAKGAAPVLAGRAFSDDPWAAALGGVGAVAGHTWPLFAAFRGGRGVATTFGAYLAIAPAAALLSIVASGAILAATRYVSVMSMVGTAFGLAVMVLWVVNGWLAAEYLVFGVAVTLSVEVNHLGNLRRVRSGTEPRMGQGGAPRAQHGA
ncbi:MAG: glycerol-3-phosphate 1-O-acyltransferase [Dehalococcoidia bacterium]|nr:glycerol-3-phosphate 1-O-acyltransferase [Dehalococcoidia bacterium]